MHNMVWVIKSILAIGNQLPPYPSLREMKRLTILNYVARGSGVAWVPCALGQEIFLRPPSTKLTKFELKNKRKSAEEA